MPFPGYHGYVNNTVVVHKDPRLDMLVNKQAQINEETSRDSGKPPKVFA
jgi:hypothetical protein